METSSTKCPIGFGFLVSPLNMEILNRIREGSRAIFLDLGFANVNGDEACNGWQTNQGDAVGSSPGRKLLRQ